MKILAATAEEMQLWGEKIGHMLHTGDVVALTGPLGAGKTTFVGGLAKGLGIDPRYRVTSPTFVFARIYKGAIPLYHIDLYRVEDAKELDSLGLEEMIGTDGVATIEWFEKFPQTWTGDRLHISFDYGDGDSRSLLFESIGDRFVDRIKSLDKAA